jgi:hypothetical protein
MHNTKKTLRGDFAIGKRDCPDQLHPDQMVLGTIGREAGHRERRPKALRTRLTQGGHQA